MVDEDVPCEDVLAQINAAKSALNGCGKVEQEVLAACVTYLRISAYSYPALAIYNAGAALYRSFGKAFLQAIAAYRGK